jgi:hypothetical protein
VVRSKLSAKVALLVAGIGLSATTFAGPASAQTYCPDGTYINYPYCTYDYNYLGYPYWYGSHRGFDHRGFGHVAHFGGGFGHIGGGFHGGFGGGHR